MLAEGRRRLGLDQKGFGQAVGVGQKAVSRWERGVGRPRRAVVVKVADVLGLSVEDVLAAAGYGAVADSADELTLPVRALSQTLPFSQLSPERFEFACLDILEHLYPGGHASRYGGSGETQDGIDLLVKVDGRRGATGQCKRRAQFGPQDVRDAIDAVVEPAPQNYLFLARSTATAAARDAIDGVPNWELWDGEDLSRYVRRQMSLDEGIRFVDTYFPNHREAFLDIPRPSPWLSVAQFYASTSGSATFTHSWTLSGRQNELAALENALVSGDPAIAILYGRGGIGKTRLLRSVAEKFEAEDWSVRMLPQDSITDPAAFAQLPSYGKSLLIVDDAHARGDLGQIVSQAQTRNPDTRMLIACRPYGKHDLARDLGRAGFLLSELPSVTLDDLSQDEATALAKAALGPECDVFADRLAMLTRDCPLATTIGGQLIQSGALAPRDLEQDSRLRDHILDGYRAALIAAAAHGGQERRTAVLDAVALLQPFRSGSDSFREAIAELVGVSFSRISPHLRSLEDSGVLIRRGDSVRIVPDLLGDIVLARACFDERADVDTGYLSEVLAIARDEVLENVFVNVSRVDWQVDHRLSRTAEPLWTTVQRSLETRTIETYLRILNLLRRVAAFRPLKAIDAVRWMLDNPLDTLPSSMDVPEFFRQTWRDVLNEIPAVLRVAARDSEAIPLACAILWELTQAEQPEINQHGNQPLNVLHEIAAYAPNKHLAYSITVLDLAEQWSATESRHSPLRAIEPLVATESHYERYHDYRLSFYPFAINQGVVHALRRRAIELALAQIRSGNNRRGVAGAEFIALALRYPTGGFGRRVEPEERRSWDTDFLSTIEGLLAALRSTEPDPVVYLAVLDAVHWHAQYGQGPVHDAVEALLGAIPDTVDFDIALQLHDGWGNLIREKGTENGEFERATAERLERIAARAVGAADDHTLVSLIEDRIQREFEVFDRDPSGGRQLLRALFDQRNTLADIVVDRLFDNTESPLGTLTSTVVDLIGTRRPELLPSTVRRLLNHPTATVQTDTALGLARRDRSICVLYNGELQLLESFARHPDSRVREATAGAANAIAPTNLPVANRLLTEIRFADSPRAASQVFMVISAPSSKLSWANLDNQQRASILSQLTTLPNIDDHWIMRFLRQRSSEPTDVALHILRTRIEIDETRGRVRGYQPIPFHWHEPLAFRERPDFLTILRELLSWLAQRDTSQHHGTGGDLFMAAVGAFDEPVLSALLENLRTGGEPEVRTLAYVLNSAPQDLVFQHISFVSEALASAARYGTTTLAVMERAFWCSAMTGSRHGTPGQPYPEDLRLRDECAQIANTLPLASPATRFYRSLSESAAQTIAHDIDHDRDDHREW